MGPMGGAGSIPPPLLMSAETPCYSITVQGAEETLKGSTLYVVGLSPPPPPTADRDPKPTSPLPPPPPPGAAGGARVPPDAGPEADRPRSSALPRRHVGRHGVPAHGQGGSGSPDEGVYPEGEGKSYPKEEKGDPRGLGSYLCVLTNSLSPLPSLASPPFPPITAAC